LSNVEVVISMCLNY